MARPTKLTDEIEKQIASLVKQGVRPEVAAGTLGIGRRTYFDWMHLGASEVEGPHERFRTAVTCALDHFEADATKVILEGDEQGLGFGPAKAKLEVLSRRMPRQWAQQVKHHVETVEDEFLSALEAVCADPAVHERVRTQQDCRLLFVAFCEALARRESEGEASGDPSRGTGPSPVH